MDLSSERVRASLDRASAFLRTRLRVGAYALTCVGGDGGSRFSDNKGHVFVAGFMAEALAGSLDEIDRTIILVRILSEENDGQWGFSPPGPRHQAPFLAFHVDADDTAYVIRTLRRLGVNRPPEALVRYHREVEGLFVTFDTSGSPKLATELSVENNFGAHLEVNANVFLALKDTHLDRLINFELLRDTQEPDGGWRSYFYPSPLFATQLAVDLLADVAGFEPVVERALAFVAASQNADGSWGVEGDAHETALGVTILAGRPSHAAAAARGVEHLLSIQGADGGWASTACIWEFPAAGGDVWRAYDADGAYVSARCTTALHHAAGAGS